MKKDCNNCEYISITEEFQKYPTIEPHICKLLNQRVYHVDRHPKLKPLSNCPLNQVLAEVAVDNITLRKLLWSRHGCHGACLYGDDGELQCNSCRLDFKRDSASSIATRLFDISIQKLK